MTAALQMKLNLRLMMVKKNRTVALGMMREYHVVTSTVLTLPL